MLKRKKVTSMPIPDGFTPDMIRIEASVCTGEKTIGFYSKADKRLHFSELVRNENDIAAFYERYGVSPQKKGKSNDAD